jgi:hypothetical protein
LPGVNKQVQTEYWNLIKEKNWNKYRLPSTLKGADSILESVVVKNPDFNNLQKITQDVERGTLEFIENVQNFLFDLKP